MTQEEIKAAIEHRDVIDDIRAILATSSGQRFFKYLFKSFDVGHVPEMGLREDILMDRIGFLRAGHSIFKLAAEANADITGALLAQKERELYAALYNLEPETK